MRAADVVGAMQSGCDVFASLKVGGCRMAAGGRPEFVCGGSAVVFTVEVGGCLSMLKCFLRSGGYRRRIYDYIAETGPVTQVPARLFVDEMCVWDSAGRPRRTDVVVAPWVAGHTLGDAVRDAVLRGDSGALAALACGFVPLAQELVSAPWAHGDLKPDNVVVKPDGGMVLVDYDAMFVPSLAGLPAEELGTPGWQHPGRTAIHFDSRTDDYSIALLCVTLCAVAMDSSLWREAVRSGLRLIDPTRAVAGSCQLLDRVRIVFGSAGFGAGTALCDMLSSPGLFLLQLPSVLDGCRKTLPGLLRGGGCLCQDALQQRA